MTKLSTRPYTPVFLDNIPDINMNWNIKSILKFTELPSVQNLLLQGSEGLCEPPGVAAHFGHFSVQALVEEGKSVTMMTESPGWTPHAWHMCHNKWRESCVSFGLF